MKTRVALKIDVDTYRGIAEGTARLAAYLHTQSIPASFFVSLGPDNSGWAATRVFRHRGFFKKMQRTSALSLYGWRTAFSGTLLPARPMGMSFRKELLMLRDLGFEVSPHGFDHIDWHDHAADWSTARASSELAKLLDVYHAIFRIDPTSFAAPGWQTGPGVWRAIDSLGLLYHSDTRGIEPYWPMIGDDRLHTLEIPTTMPTWDEMLAWDGVTLENLVAKTIEALHPERVNVWTIHAEVEGTAYFKPFQTMIERLKADETEWIFLPRLAQKLKLLAHEVPVGSLEQNVRQGRAGTVSCQAIG